MFTCIDCGIHFQDGMDVEIDMYLNMQEDINFGGKRCVYCYNDQHVLHQLDPAWNIETSNRLRHEEKIKEIVELYTDLPHDYYTNAEYQLVITFPRALSTENIKKLRQTLQVDGMLCGTIQEVTNTFFTVDFKDTRVFTR